MFLIIQVAIGVALGILISSSIKSNADKLKNNAEKYQRNFLLGCLLIGNAIYIDSFVHISPLWIAYINNTNSTFGDLVLLILATLMIIGAIPLWLGKPAAFILGKKLHEDNDYGILFLYGLLNIDVMGVLHALLLQLGISNNRDSAFYNVLIIYGIAIIYRMLKNRNLLKGFQSKHLPNIFHWKVFFLLYLIYVFYDYSKHSS